MLGRKDVKRRNGPIYFAFANFFYKKAFVGKVSKYAIKGFSHEILDNVISSLKYAKRAFLTRFYVTWYYFITRQGSSPVTMSRLGVLYECAVHGIRFLWVRLTLCRDML